MPTQMIVAAAINAVGTLILVKLLAYAVPYLRARAPDLLPIIAGMVGPLLALIQAKLAEALGVPIDLGIPAVMAVFTGASAIAIAQVAIQRQRRVAGQHAAIRLGTAPDALAAEHAPI